MGGVLCTEQQKEQFEARVEDARTEAKEIGEAIEAKAAPAVEQAQDIAKDIKDTVEEIAEKVADAVQGGAEQVEEKAGDVMDQAAEVVADVKEGAADALDAVADAATAVVASVTTTMAVEFDDGKGSVKSVWFQTQALGFSCGRAGGGCGCMSAPKDEQQVVVRNVDKNSQAAKLGVKPRWILKSVNGTDVTSLEQGSNLLKEACKSLPEA